MEKYILTIDVGTTSVKVAAFDRTLRCVCTDKEEYALLTETSGFIEMDPDEYLRVICKTVRRMLEGREEVGENIAAVIPTTQGETLTPVDEAGRALRNSIVWLDGRAEAQAARLSGSFPPELLFSMTGVAELTGTVPVCKALWIKDNEPEVYARTHKFLLLEDWVLYFLSGKFVTEKVLLSSTGYYNIVDDCYYGDILAAAGLEARRFPTALEPGASLGRILPATAARLGISPNAVVYAGAMDQPAGALAAGNYREGVVTETTGTSLVIGAASAKPDFHHPLRAIIYRHVIPGMYIVIPVCMTAGIVLKWFLDSFCDEYKKEPRPYEALNALARDVKPGSDGLILLPYFTGIMTPEVNPNACGVLFGLDLSMGKAHVTRAIMESVGYMLKENLAIVKEASNCDYDEIRSLGGGSQSDVWLQIKADICGVNVNRMEYTECTSLGVAIIAAVAMGWFTSYETAVNAANGVRHVFRPREENRAVYQAGYDKFRALYAALKPVFYKRSKK